MEQNLLPYAESAMLIRRNVNDVFNALIDPEITTNFWFTKSSGPLIQSQIVRWEWEMYNHSLEVNVLEIVDNEKILMQWGEDPKALVVWKFEAYGSEATFLHVVNTGFKGNAQEVLSQVRDTTGGFCWVLAGMKAYLEHGIRLNLIADRFPKKPE